MAMTFDRFPVAVITACEPVTGNPWIRERWRVLGIVAGAAVAAAAPQRTLQREGPEGRQYLWSGFEIRLNKTDADSYYYNLVGQNPGMQVVCRTSDDGEPVPLLVTADYIDAMAHREAGCEVHAVPMPPEVHAWLEQYVLEHYVPEESKPKRKHEDWTKEVG